MLLERWSRRRLVFSPPARSLPACFLLTSSPRPAPHPTPSPPSPDNPSVWPGRDMQSLLHCRAFDLADEHRCLLIAIDDGTPEGRPAGHAPLPPEWPRRNMVNLGHGSCIKLRCGCFF